MTAPPNDDSDLRALFEDAVSDVHPVRRPKHVRVRARRPTAGRWVPLTLAAAVATVAVIGGAGWLGRQGDDPASVGPGGPNGPVVQEAERQEVPTRTVRVPVYYVGSTAAGPRLFAETHTVHGVSRSNLDAGVQEALGAPALDPDYDVSGPTEGVDARTSTDGTTITIDLSSPLERPAEMSSEAAAMAVQALVWTSDEMARSNAPVRFTVDGEAVAQVLGVDTSLPVQRTPADSTLAPVSISSPTEGATVPTQFEVTGQAATFEANVVWELKRGDQTVRNGYTTAKQCCTLSPYTFTVIATPGDYTLVVHDTDESDGEGIGTSEDSKRITVQ